MFMTLNNWNKYALGACEADLVTVICKWHSYQ